MTELPEPLHKPQTPKSATGASQADQRKGLFADGSTFTGPVIGYQENNVTHTLLAPPAPGTLNSRQRAELLDRLALRYRELLDHALAHQVRLQLGLHTRPDTVDPVWRRMLLRGSLTAQPVPPGTPVLELFDRQQGQLLVLGAAGAGKTTMILELAQALTERAQADAQTRIPVIVNLSSWRSGQSLRDWLQRVLRDVLGTSKRFAAQLAGSDELLLLLDGLDEVAADQRTECVAAISAYLCERDLAPPLVVGCRSREYAELGTRLPITGAVELEPLELPAIEQALAGVPAAAGVLVALQTDELLRELATTPLMVNVLLLAHGGQEVPLVQVQTLEGRRRALWWAYVRRMIVQRPIERPKMMLRYLRWLAQQLRGQSETNFLIDDLQPSMVPLGKQPRRYGWIACIGGGFLGAIIGACIGWVAVACGVADVGLQRDITLPVDGAVLLGISGVVIGGLVGCLAGSMYDQWNQLIRRPIERTEKLYWSWARVRTFLSRAKDYRILLITVIALYLIIGMAGFTFIPSWIGITLGIGYCTILVICLGVYIGGYQRQDLPKRTFPMQGVRASFWTSLVNMWVIALFFGVFFVFVLLFLLRLEVMDSLRIGLVVFFMVIFYSSFDSYFQHYALRFILWRAHAFPFRAVTFLEAMTERLLLERDGALYRFHHLLLRDFFADLDDEEINELMRDA